MANPADRRDSPRIPVGPDYTIRFTILGHDYREVRITNLSLGGCFAIVGGSDAHLFRQGSVLESFILGNREFPSTPFGAIVAYAMGTSHDTTQARHLGLGIKFQTVPEEVTAALHAFLERALGRPWPSQG